MSDESVLNDLGMLEFTSAIIKHSAWVPGGLVMLAPLRPTMIRAADSRDGNNVVRIFGVGEVAGGVAVIGTVEDVAAKMAKGLAIAERIFREDMAALGAMAEARAKSAEHIEAATARLNIHLTGEQR